MLSIQALLNVSSALGISTDQLAAVERRDHLAHVFQVRSSAFAAVTDDLLTNFSDEYGDAARLQISVGDLPDLTVEDGTFNADDLTRLHQEAARHDVTYNVEIQIDKQGLLARELPGATGRLSHLFFFQRTLESYLAEDPCEIERQLWSRPECRLLLVVVEAGDLWLEGEWVCVVGGSALDRVGDALKRTESSNADRMADRRNDYIGWDSSIATRLTPRHFWINEQWTESKLVQLFSSHVIGLGAMYICDRARKIVHRDGKAVTQIEFRGREHVAYVPVDWSDIRAVFQDDQVAATVQVVDWCYQTTPERPAEDMVADRLPFVQTRLAQLLETRPESDRLVALAGLMGELQESVKGQWQSFIEGRVTQYLEQVKALEDVVNDTVGRFSEQTAFLSSKLTETALAAVAALVGSFIAAAFQKPFQKNLFEIAILTYAGYVAVFPLLVGVQATVGQARIVQKSFGVQKSNFAYVLGQKRVDELIGDRISMATRRFDAWKWIARAMYVLGVAAAITGAFLIPDVVA